MMGSRGEEAPAVAALRMQYELLELAKSADLPAHIAELREAEKAARTALGELDKRTAELDARQKALDERASVLETRETQTTERETTCSAREEETARQQASFDEQKAVLATQSRELDDAANLLVADKAAFDKIKLFHADEHQANAKALVAENDRQQRGREAAIKMMRDQAISDIAEMRAKAQAEITAEQELLKAREDKIAAREEELHRERARISALLQE